MVTFVHFADAHLGKPFAGLAPDKGKLRRADLLRAVERCFEEAERRHADALLIAGDLFDAENAQPDQAQAVWALARRLGESTGARVFIAPGNHDPAEPGSPYLDAEVPQNVHVFRKPRWERAELAGRAAIWGIAYDPDRPGRNVIAELREALADDDPLPRVVLVHAVHRGLATDEERYFPFADDDLAGLPVAYVALGHAHAARAVGPGAPPAWYPGSPELVEHEPHESEHGALAVTVSSEGTRVERLPLGRRRCLRLTVDVSRCAAQADVLREVLREADSEAVVRVVLAGHRPAEFELDVDELAAALRERLFWAEVRDETVLPPELEAPEGTVRGEFIRRMREKLAASDDPEQRRIIEDALRFGLLALEGKLRR